MQFAVTYENCQQKYFHPLPAFRSDLYKKKKSCDYSTEVIIGLLLNEVLEMVILFQQISKELNY